MKNMQNRIDNRTFGAAAKGNCHSIMIQNRMRIRGTNLKKFQLENTYKSELTVKSVFGKPEKK